MFRPQRAILRWAIQLVDYLFLKDYFNAMDSKLFFLSKTQYLVAEANCIVAVIDFFITFTRKSICLWCKKAELEVRYEKKIRKFVVIYDND
jgi:hypothetical protein